MKDLNIDEILERAAQARHPVDPALLARVSTSIAASLRPVRPLASASTLAWVLLALTTAIAVVSALALGPLGIQKLSGAEIGTIFPVLGIFTWLAAQVCVAEMTPGSVISNPAMRLLTLLVIWLAVDAIFFHDYGMNLFLPQGIPCLRAGLIVAMPTGIAAWLVLRRGFAVDRSAAGLSAGTLAGLAGLIMLEIHCPNFHAMHVMVWHTAVVPLSALAGFIVARIPKA